MRVQTADRLNFINEYYFSRKLSQIREMESKGIDVINLGIGNPDGPPSPEVIASVVSAANNSYSHGYQPYRGIRPLRVAFSEWYKTKFGVDLSPDNEILPLMGSKEGITHISLAFLNKGDGVLIPDPGYPAYESTARISGARCIFYNLDHKNSWCPNFSEIENEGLAGVKLMWVNYPNMPTGSRGSAKLFENLIEFGLKHNILIINDNPYSFILNQRPLSILSVDGAKEIALELNSLSKSHNMAGWRIGMVAGSSDHIDAVLKIKSNMDSGMFLPVQNAAITALSLGDNWYESINIIYRERREIAYEILNSLNCRFDKDQTGLFIWASLPDEWDSSIEFSEHLLNRINLFITPGSVFGANGRSYVRISLTVPAERLRESLARIDKKNEFSSKQVNIV